MLSRGLLLFTDIPMTVVGMILFMAVFTAVTVWTFFRFQSREFYQDVAEMPLREEGHRE